MNTTNKTLIKENIQFSLPVLLSMLCTSLSGFLVMILIARLGKDALAASALIYVIYNLFFTLAFSLLVPIGIFAAQAFGANRLQDTGPLFWRGCVLVLLITGIIVLCIPFIKNALLYFGQPVEVVALVVHYYKPFGFAVLPFLVILLLSQLLMAANKPITMMAFSLLGTPVNLFFSYLFMFGKWVPALGIVGSSYASIISSCFVCFLMIGYLVRSGFFKKFKVDTYRSYSISYRLLFKTGVPIAIQRLSEVFALTLLTMLMAKLPNPVAALGAQQVIMQCSMIALMVPFAMAQSAGVLVGRAMGQGDIRQATKQCYISVWVGCLLMVLIGLSYIVFSKTILGVYIKQDNLIALHYGHILLISYAFLQVIDAARNILTGALRGFGDTFVPMIVGIVATILTGVPLAYVFTFVLSHQEIAGIPIGFSIGLALGVTLLVIRASKIPVVYNITK